MKYWLMLLVAGSMAIISSLLTAFGMAELFSAVGSLILIMFVIIDLGRFLLFNFVVTEWSNLRKVKYFICLILAMLFVYSGIGIFAKLESLVSGQTKEAMVNMASYIKAEDNANLKQNRSEDLAQLARKEYDEAMSWNRLDYDNCIKRANKDPRAENNCNNTKRRLDKSASATLQQALDKADKNLEGSEKVVQENAQNKSEISTILFTICRISQRECKTYDDLQVALSILIFLVIIGTDYLQIAIVLAVNTRKNRELHKPIRCEVIEEKKEENVDQIKEKAQKKDNQRKKAPEEKVEQVVEKHEEVKVEEEKQEKPVDDFKFEIKKKDNRINKDDLNSPDEIPDTSNHKVENVNKLSIFKDFYDF